MEKIILKVEDVQPAKRKDKRTIEGIGKNGKHWQLFKVNQKYSYFHHGEGKPEFELGKEYPFDLEAKQDGEYTNYQISQPKKGNPATPGKEYDQGEEILKALREIWKKIDIIEKFLIK